MSEFMVNRTEFIKDFEQRFGSTSPDFVHDMLERLPYLKRAWDRACELDKKGLTVKNETIRGRSCFVTRDDHYRVVKLSIPVRGSWEEYEGNGAQRKYDALIAPYRMAAYND